MEVLEFAFAAHGSIGICFCSTWKYWNLLLQQAEVPGTGSEAWTMYENAKE